MLDLALAEEYIGKTRGRRLLFHAIELLKTMEIQKEVVE